MNITKKNIINNLLFMLGLLLTLMVASIFFQPKNNTSKNGMEDCSANGILAEPKDTIDVVFLGDSVTYCSVMPMQIWKEQGITSYVCATSLQKLYYSKEFLYKTFENQSPQIVFMGTSAMFHEFDYIENIKMEIERAFPVFRYHDRWKKWTTLPEWKAGLEINYTYSEKSKGYYFCLASEEVDVGDYAKPVDFISEIPSVSKKTLLQMIEICEDNGAELVLLSEPNAAGAWGPHRHNGIALLAQELGLEYLDLNLLPEEVDINWSEDSFDLGDHLNYYGAQKVSSYIGKYLAGKQLFEDKRENPQYSIWNEEMEEFYKEKPL